ncbi:ATP-binding cassette domain-containing protein, partial [Thioclava sp. BHET1]
MTAADVLRVEDLEIAFRVMGGEIRAVRGVSFRVLPGRVTALVGESGSGKSVISQAVLGLLPGLASVSGRVLFTDPAARAAPIDILNLPQDGTELRRLRGGRMAKIFQEPMTSLSPLHTIGNQISEALRIHEKCSKDAARARVVEM